MNRDSLLRYLDDRPGSVEDYPFGDDVAVFKVGGRVFALCALSGQPGSVSLKCDPTLAEALRERYPAVTPGYHLNKRHWNTIELDGSVPGDELAELVDHSWELVVAKLPRREREALGAGKTHRSSSSVAPAWVATAAARTRMTSLPPEPTDRPNTRTQRSSTA